MILEDFRQYLKRYRIARFANAHMRSWQVRHEYSKLCRRYHTSSVMIDGPTVARLAGELLDRNETLIPPCNTNERPRILFVGMDWEQDRSGIVQGLAAVADVVVFSGEPGHPGQVQARFASEIEAVRRANGERLVQHMQELEREGPVHAIVGQMWGFSMHWHALAEARARGIAVVNLSMDDRHVFVGRRLSDGSLAGTMGLIPYLTLACTAAPECVAWYEAEGCRAIYLPEASDSSLFRPLSGSKAHDVCFVGTNYGVRAMMVRSLEREGVRVQTYGTGWPNGRLPTDGVPGLFARSRIVLGCGTIGSCSGFFALKLRDFDGPMSGSLYMTHDNPDLHALFRSGEEIVVFRDLPDMVAKVKYYLTHDEERERIARRGCQRATRQHTWVRRFQAMMTCLRVTRNTVLKS